MNLNKKNLNKKNLNKTLCLLAYSCSLFLISTQAHAYANLNPNSDGYSSSSANANNDDGYSDADLSGGDDSYYSDQPVAGVYFGASGGFNDFDISKGTEAKTVNGSNYNYSTDSDKFTGNIHMGSLWGINQTFSMGLELGATYWGNYKFNGTNGSTGQISYDQESINALFDLQWNVTSRIFLMPQLGIAFNFGGSSGSLTSADGNSVEGGTRHKATPLVGVNLGFNVTPAFSIYLSGQELFGDTPGSSSSSTDFSQNLIKSTTASLGFNYNIGQ